MEKGLIGILNSPVKCRDNRVKAFQFSYYKSLRMVLEALIKQDESQSCLTLFHSERPKLHIFLALLSAKGLKPCYVLGPAL